MEYNEFPIETLPESFQALIHHKYEIEGWEKKTLAVSLLSATATAIGSAVSLNNGKWTEIKPILWVAVLGESGTAKTHIMQSAFDFIHKVNRDSMLQYEAELNAFEKDKNNALNPNRPKPTNYILKDFTPESIAVTHKNNDKGLVIFQDELAGWIKRFDRYSGGGEKELYLELYNGNAIQVNRANKPPLYVDEPCVNIIGGIQPSKLALISNSESEGDGFLQRFLFVRHKPSKADQWTLEEVNKDILKAVAKTMEQVFNVDEKCLSMDKETQLIFKSWYDQKNLEVKDDEFQRTIQKKLETNLFRLCLILDVLDQVESGSSRDIVASSSMEKAIQLIEFFRTEMSESLLELKDPLSKEGDEATELYNQLNGREYTTKELQDHFKPVWTSTRTIDKKLKSPLFKKVRHGVYLKAIQDAE